MDSPDKPDLPTHDRSANNALDHVVEDLGSRELGMALTARSGTKQTRRVLASLPSATPQRCRSTW